MKHSIRRLLLVAVIGLTFLGIAAPLSLARPSRAWTQQELFDESDVVVVATASERKKTENSDAFLTDYLQQYETELEVKSVLKGQEKDPAFKEKVEPKLIKFVHFRYRPDVKSGLGNGPHFAIMGTALMANGKPTTPPRYLLYLRKRKDGRYEPVSGNMDPVDSIIRLLIFPEYDPALDADKADKFSPPIPLEHAQKKPTKSAPTPNQPKP